MIIDFLKTKISKKDLAVVLKVLRRFKSCESQAEWAWTHLEAWTKLEQLEEYLEHLVNKKPLNKDTVEYIERQKAEEKSNKRSWEKYDVKSGIYYFVQKYKNHKGAGKIHILKSWNKVLCNTKVTKEYLLLMEGVGEHHPKLCAICRKRAKALEKYDVTLNTEESKK